MRMTQIVHQRRQFRIERLEERLVPGCLLWNGGVLDQDIDALAASFSADAAPAVSLMAAPTHQMPVINPEVACPDADRRQVSREAEEVLRQIERELPEFTSTVESPVDSLLQGIDERFNIWPTPATARLSEADRLLLEIDRELKGQAAQSVPCATADPQRGPRTQRS